jgi:hypothetical protein
MTSQMMGRKSSTFLQLQCIGYYLSFAFIHVKCCGSLVVLLMFLHRQEQGGQDRVFQFGGGLANYKSHNDIS